MIRGDELQDYDREALFNHLKPSGAIGLSDLPKNKSHDTAAQSQLRELLSRVGGNEVILVAETPLTVAVGSPAGFAATSSSSLRSAFGIARVIAQRDSILKETA